MGPRDAPHLSHSESLWLNWFMDGIFNSDIDETGVLSLLHYLVDLNILEIFGDGSLKLSGVRQGQSSDEARVSLLETLNAVSKTESGFALVYFLTDPTKSTYPSLKQESSSSETKRKSLFGKSFSHKETKSSNLSNLQIVKKWGKELRPFLDLEQRTIARLSGTYTSQKDAQWLFSYILNKTRKKSPAKKWEQISRKRHR